MTRRKAPSDLEKQLETLGFAVRDEQENLPAGAKEMFARVGAEILAIKEGFGLTVKQVIAGLAQIIASCAPVPHPDDKVGADKLADYARISIIIAQARMIMLRS